MLSCNVRKLNTQQQKPQKQTTADDLFAGNTGGFVCTNSCQQSKAGTPNKKDGTKRRKENTPQRPSNLRSQVSAELVVAAALGEVCLGRELVGLVQQVLGEQVPQQQVQRRGLPDLVVPVAWCSNGAAVVTWV